MAFALTHPVRHTPSAWELALVDQCRHSVRWLRAAWNMTSEERTLTWAMQTPLAVLKPANARTRR